MPVLGNLFGCLFSVVVCWFILDSSWGLLLSGFTAPTSSPGFWTCSSFSETVILKVFCAITESEFSLSINFKVIV